MLSYEYWQRAFNGDRKAIGKVIEVDRATPDMYTIAAQRCEGLGESQRELIVNEKLHDV